MDAEPDAPHYEVVATYQRPHPLDVPTLKEPLEAASGHRPAAHLRLSPTTWDAVKAISSQERRHGGWAAAPFWGVPVVPDEDVPDDEWRIAVWQIGAAP